MTYEKYVFPLFVAASVVTVYGFFRGSGGSGPLQATVPNPASGGVKGVSTVPSVGTARNVEAVQYDANLVPVNPSIYSLLTNPLDSTPSDPDDVPPAYLAFNFPPASNLSVTPQDNQVPDPNLTSNQNTFVDGGGSTLLSSTRGRQLTAQNGWLPTVLQNVEAYLSLEWANETPTPTLTSYVPSGSLN